MENQYRKSCRNPGEFQDSAGFIAKLRDTNNPVSQYIGGMLLAETAQLVKDYENLSSVHFNVEAAIHKNITQILRREKLLFDDQILEQLDISEELSEMIENNPTGNDLINLNRLLLHHAFPNEFTKRSLPKVLVFFEILKIIVYEIQRIPLFIFVLIGIILFGGAYYIAFATIQVKFSDVRHTDEMLEHFVEQMGFKPPIKERGNLVFKPTLSKIIKEILIGFPTKLMARIEGNSVVITSTIPTVKQLTKQMKAFSI